MAIGDGEQKPEDLRSFLGGREGGVTELRLLKYEEEADIRLCEDCCLWSENEEEHDPRGRLPSTSSVPSCKLFITEPVGLCAQLEDSESFLSRVDRLDNRRLGMVIG